MKLAFFSARDIHRRYFELLASTLKQRGDTDYAATVLWHKTLWLDLRWTLQLLVSYPDLPTILADHIVEKRNSRKGHNRSQKYWPTFALVKRIEMRVLAAIYRQALIHSQCQKIVVWNGLKYRQRIALAAADSLNMGHLVLENGLLPGMTTLDGRGVNYLNSVPRNPAFFRDWQEKHNIASHGVLNWSKKGSSKKGASPKDSPETENAPYIFVPLQVNTDSQIVLFSPWIDNMEHLIRVLSAAALALGEQIPKIIIKTHPACDSDYSQLAAQLPSTRIELITSGDTPSLIANATGVVTINSTVGIEAILAGIPTLVLGQAFYAVEGLTLFAQNETTLASGLIKLSSFTADAKLRAGWLHYLRDEYQVSGNWRKADESHLAAMTDKIIQTVTSA